MWNWQSVRPAAGGRGALLLPARKTILVTRTEQWEGKPAVICASSTDDGKTWRDLGVVVADETADADLGDGNLLQRSGGGALFYCFRQNYYRGDNAAPPRYAIRVAESRDNGRTWQPHSTVTEHTVREKSPPSRGLWAPFMFETPDRRLQCYYDDENTPLLQGFRGHQWLMMRTWNPASAAWENPVVVSRAHDPKHLSRDGMGTVVALSSQRLLCALESVQTDAPHAGVIRCVTSEDGGKTWSWQRAERGIVYAPEKKPFMALSPFLIRLPEDTLCCVLCTDEDRQTPDRPGTPPHQLHMDIKLVTRSPADRNWSSAETIFGETHRSYLPGIVGLSSGRVLALFLDFEKGGHFCRTGEQR